MSCHATRLCSNRILIAAHLIGKGLTLADYSLIHVEMFKEVIPFDWSPYPNINKHYEPMRAVSHWAKTAPVSPEAMGRRPKAVHTVG